MAKEKKIGINFFLNERLKPGKFNGQDIFPVYARITFDRKNHQCPAPVGSMTKEQFEEKIVNSGKPEFNKILQEFEDKIRSVIAEE
ncbi:MAG: hypothetical protein KDD04_08205 [Sinomicrobium sp.]|nr:hypothetical protein [Sinomicrobium sp.]